MLTSKQQKQRKLIYEMGNVIADSTMCIKDVKKGSFINYNNEDYYVEEIGIYNEVKWKNFAKKKKDYYVTEFKLFSLQTGEIIYIEWEEDDEIEIYVTTDIIKLNDIKIGSKKLTTSDLEDIAEEETGGVTVNNVTFYYEEDDTWAALYSSEKYKEAKVKIYEFINKKNISLSIEAWEDEDEKPEKEAFLSKKIKEEEIKILKV